MGHYEAPLASDALVTSPRELSLLLRFLVASERLRDKC